jgi:hypothetical protein
MDVNILPSSEALLKKLIASKKNFIVDEEDILSQTYLITYPEYIRYFREIKGKIEHHHLLIGIGFAYSWMPRILRILKAIDNNTLNIINNAKGESYISKEDIEVLMDTFDNSITSVSKLLHFIHPEKYGIFDNKVFSSIASKRLSNQKDKAGLYLSYTRLIEDVTKLDEYENIHDEVQEKLKIWRPISRIRSAELILFAAVTESKG